MDYVLQKHLVKKHHIFFDHLKKDKDDIMIPIYFGFECGDGWYHILDTLMGSIKHHQKFKKIEPIKIKQIKEKFGTLSFYYTGGDEYIHGLVSMASSMSARTCEGCGTTENVGMTSGGWYSVSCENCFNKNLRLRGLKWNANPDARILKISKLLNNGK